MGMTLPGDQAGLPRSLGLKLGSLREMTLPKGALGFRLCLGNGMAGGFPLALHAKLSQA